MEKQKKSNKTNQKLRTFHFIITLENKFIACTICLFDNVHVTEKKTLKLMI